MTRPGAPCRGEAERGSITLLSIGFVVMAIALVCVVVDASSAYLARRSLAALADGASLTAAQSIDVHAVYAGAGTTGLPIDGTAAGRAAAGYVQANAAGTSWSALGTAVSSDGRSVTVVVHGRHRLPFLGRIARLTGIAGSGTVDITVASRATSPFLPG